ncbi:hypothetical protein KIW84_034965 [Lathyrus oleraceus]|uniref:Uncharacterized protein n=1 Tax=Pisum sativum TaxID=3888 RepID=A0A9D4XZT5_PEA|nr:hypothetical protein KIW84_034965 [Pisum sativum]
MSKWIQNHGLEQLTELSSNLFSFVLHDVTMTDESVELVNSFLQMIVSVLKFSQKRKICQPHFILSIDGLYQIYQAGSVSSVINGKLHHKSNDIYSGFAETHKLEPLHSLLVHVENTARQKWNFNGYITSDCAPVAILHDMQGYAKTPEDVVADTLKAGMGVECGDNLTKLAKSAVLQNKVPISQIDCALHNLFSIQIRLGLFDGNPTKLKYGTIGPNQVCSKQNLNIALEAARSGIRLKLLRKPEGNEAFLDYQAGRQGVFGSNNFQQPNAMQLPHQSQKFADLAQLHGSNQDAQLRGQNSKQQQMLNLVH